MVNGVRRMVLLLLLTEVDGVLVEERTDVGRHGSFVEVEERWRRWLFWLFWLLLLLLSAG